MGTAPRALVVAYDFPPHGAIGTMRTLRLVRELDATGWTVTVLTGSPRSYLPDTPVEPALEAQIPPSVQVLRPRAVRPFNTLEGLVRRRAATGGPAERQTRPSPETSPRAAVRTRGWIGRVAAVRDSIESVLDIPDKESGWMAPAVAAGLSHMRRTGKPDVIYSSAPPWSGQVVGLLLARAAGRPWVADFRDPWARAPWRDWKPLRRRAIVALERRVIERADATLFVTHANLAEYARHYGPEYSQRFHLIPNGCDPSEIEAIEPGPRDDAIVLLHAGTLYGARSPLPVIHAIARAVARGALDRHRFRLRLLGTVSLAFDVRGECRRLGIEDVVEFVPRVTRAESLRDMKSAAALLLIQTGTVVSVPGKAYEYLATGRPILALSDEGETATLVRASGAGISVKPDEPIETVEAAVLDVMSRAGAPHTRVEPQWFDGRLHAASTAGLLLDLIHRSRTRTTGTVERTTSAVARAEGEPR